jgi:hypothetical protein
MTTGFVQRCGQAFVNSAVASSLAVPVSAACAAGSSVLLVFRSPSGGTLTGVSDNAGGNTWGLEYTAVDTTYVYRCNLATALTTSDTITVAYSAAQADGIYAMADNFTGLGVYDVSKAMQISSVNPATLSLTATAYDLVVYAAYLYFGQTGTVSFTGSFTATGSSQVPGGSQGNVLLTAYDPSPSAGSITASVTNPATHTQEMIMLAYRAPAVAGTAGALMAGFPA